MRLTPKELLRFNAKIDKTAGMANCWPWLAGTNQDGYGQIGIRRNGRWRILKAHRLAWMIAANKQIPVGKYILHFCDNPRCCNPRHLRLGTQKENMQDASRRNRIRCGMPNNVGVKNGAAKLNDADVRAIRAQDGPLRPIAEQYGVTVSLVCMIRKRRVWSHVD